MIAFDRGDSRDRDRVGLALVPGVVLNRELDRLAQTRSKHDGLPLRQESETVLEADVGARVEAEQAAESSARTVVLEFAANQIQVEPVRQMKVALMLRQPKCRRQADKREVRLHLIQRARIVVGPRRRGGSDSYPRRRVL